jgi:hypothetical protein
MKKFNKTKKNNKKKGGNNNLTNDDYFINPNFRKIILEPVFTTFNILFKNNTGKYEKLNGERLLDLHFVEQYKIKIDQNENDQNENDQNKNYQTDFKFSPFFIYDVELNDYNNYDYKKDYGYIDDAKEIIGSNDKDVYLIFLYVDNNIFKLDYFSGINTLKEMFGEITWDEIKIDKKANKIIGEIYAVIEINNGEIGLK